MGDVQALGPSGGGGGAGWSGSASSAGPASSAPKSAASSRPSGRAGRSRAQARLRGRAPSRRLGGGPRGALFASANAPWASRRLPSRFFGRAERGVGGGGMVAATRPPRSRSRSRSRSERLVRTRVSLRRRSATNEAWLQLELGAVPAARVAAVVASSFIAPSSRAAASPRFVAETGATHGRR